MMRLVPLLLAMTMMWNPARAEQIAEVDLDGVMGNGPDTVEVSTGDLVQVDLWLANGPDLIAFDCVVCEPLGILAFQNAQYHTVGGWIDMSPAILGSGCTELGSADYGNSPIQQPWAIVSLFYSVTASEGFGEIAVDTTNTTLWYSGITQGTVDVAVSSFVRVSPTTSTVQRTWSSIKSFFR